MTLNRCSKTRNTWSTAGKPERLREASRAHTAGCCAGLSTPSVGVKVFTRNCNKTHYELSGRTGCRRSFRVLLMQGGLRCHGHALSFSPGPGREASHRVAARCCLHATSAVALERQRMDLKCQLLLGDRQLPGPAQLFSKSLVLGQAMCGAASHQPLVSSGTDLWLFELGRGKKILISKSKACQSYPPKLNRNRLETSRCVV